MISERDLDDYQLHYRNQPYERFQIHFRRRKVREILIHHNHDILLEVGCGLNAIFNDVSTYKKLYVVEPGGAFYDKALEDLKQLHRKNDVLMVKGFIEDCDEAFKDVRFDFILISSLLHEIPDQSLFLHKIHSMAAENTIVHINVPNAKSFHRLLAVEMGLIKNEYVKSESNNQFQQNAVFDTTSLVELVEKNGFDVIESGCYSFKPFTHLQMENLIQSGLISEDVLEGFYKMEKYLPGLGSEIYINVRKRTRK